MEINEIALPPHLEWIREIANRSFGMKDALGAAEINGLRYLIATDTTIAVAVRDDTTVAPPPYSGLLKAFVVAPDAVTVTIELDWLRTFVGSLIPTLPDRKDCIECSGSGEVTCSECDGSGTIECVCRECDDRHDNDCGKCSNGTASNGRVSCETCSPSIWSREHRVQFVLGAMVVNARLVHAFSCKVSGSTCSVSFRGVRDPIWFGGDGWMALVMPMENIDPTWLPVFDLPEARS